MAGIRKIRSSDEENIEKNNGIPNNNILIIMISTCPKQQIRDWNTRTEDLISEP